MLDTLIVAENELDKYELIEQIGAGGLGEVSKVEERESKARFAMKKIQMHPAGNDNKYILREVRHLLELSEYVNVVFLHEIFGGLGNKLGIIMELWGSDWFECATAVCLWTDLPALAQINHHSS